MSATTTRARSAPRARLERDSPRLTGRAAALLIAIGVLVMMALVPIGRYLEQRAAIAELERRAAQLEDRNAALRVDISKLHDPAQLEKLARECLGMVAPGEVVFVTRGEVAARADC